MPTAVCLSVCCNLLLPSIATHFTDTDDLLHCVPLNLILLYVLVFRNPFQYCRLWTIYKCCIRCQLSFAWSNWGVLDCRGIWHVLWGTREIRAGFCWGNLEEGDYLEGPGIDERIILIWTIKKLGGGVWTGLIWLGIWTGGGLLWTLELKYRKVRRISVIAESCAYCS